MSQEVLIAMIGLGGLAIGACAGAFATIASARYAWSIRVAVLEHEAGCKRVEAIEGTMRTFGTSIDRLSRSVSLICGHLGIDQ